MIEVKINSDLLNERPYQGEANTACVFNDNEVDHFVDQIIFGTPTCHLLSGYRGSGKTSFINRVKQLIELRAKPLVYQRPDETFDTGKERSWEDYAPVFAYVNYAKYNSQSAFLRQVIRSLFLAFEAKVSVEGVSKNREQKLRLDFLKSETREKFKRLYSRTFYSIQAEYEESIIKEHEFGLGFKSNLSILKGIGSIAGSLIPAGLSSYIYSAEALPLWALVLIQLMSGLGVLLGITELNYAVKNVKSQKSSSIVSELYDDEIAFYHLEMFLSEFRKQGFKIVFILDELDKVEDNDVPKLLNEMKPLLLSGLADFVVIAGQTLSYRYQYSSKKDDDVMSSLFSKNTHVSLLNRNQLQHIIKEKLFVSRDYTEEEFSLIDKFVSHQIFISKGVPRIFINRLRQSLVWRNRAAFIRIEPTKELDRHHGIVLAIQLLVETSIEREGYSLVVRDYLISQLYRFATIMEGQPADGLQWVSIKARMEEPKAFYDEYYGGFLVPLLFKLYEAVAPMFSQPIDASNNSDDPILYDNLKAEIQDATWIMRMVLGALGESAEKMRNYTSLDFLKVFVKNGYLKITLPTDALFESFMTNQVVLDDKKNLKTVHEINQAAKMDFNQLGFQVVRSFVADMLQKSTTHHKLVSEDRGFDFILKSNQAEMPDLCVDVRIVRQVQYDINFQAILDALEAYNLRSEKGNYYLILFFVMQPKEEFDSEKFRLTTDLREVISRRSLPYEMADKVILRLRTMSKVVELADDIAIIVGGLERYSIIGEHLNSKIISKLPYRNTFEFVNRQPPVNDPRRNDAVLDSVFRIPGDEHSSLVVKIDPGRTKFWRFGLKFSSSPDFPDISQGRHVDGYPDIHLSIGEPIEESQRLKWMHSNILQITEYFIGRVDKGKWAFDSYKREMVDFRVTFDGVDQAVAQVFLNEILVGQTTYKDARMRHFKLSAWSDENLFALKTDIAFSRISVTTPPL